MSGLGLGRVKTLRQKRGFSGLDDRAHIFSGSGYLPLIPGAQIVLRKPKAEEAEAPAVDEAA